MMATLQQTGIVLTTLLAAVTAFLPNQRLRAICSACTLMLAATLLTGYAWSTSALEPIRENSLLLVGLPIVAILCCLPLALCFLRWPGTLLFAVGIALPFRIPIDISGTEANLLAPLYFVIAAGVLSSVIRAFRTEKHSAGWGRIETENEGAIVQRSTRSTRVALIATALFFCAYALQTIYSSDENRALQQICFYYAPFMMLFTLVLYTPFTRQWVKRAGGALLIIASCLALIGCYEYLTHKLLLNPKAINVNIFSSFFRVSSLFFDPSIYGRFLVCVFLGSAAVLLFSNQRRRKATITLSALTLLVWVGLIPSFSQSSYVALLVGVICLLSLHFGMRKTALPIILALLGIGTVIALYPKQTGFQNSQEKKEQQTDQLTGGRNKLIDGGITLLKQRPVAGYGSGSFSAEYRRIENIKGGSKPVVSHTTPVTISAEQGMIGLTMYVAFLITVMLMFTVKLRQHKDPLLVGAFAIFCAITVHSFFYGAFFEDPVLWLALAAATLSSNNSG